MDLGVKLKNLRKSHKLSLKELSAITGISPSFLSDIENGRSNPSIENLKLIAGALDTPISYFIEDPKANKFSFIFEDNDLMSIIDLIKDFKEWTSQDKAELLYYLRAKKFIRNSSKNNS